MNPDLVHGYYDGVLVREWGLEDHETGILAKGSKLLAIKIYNNLHNLMINRSAAVLEPFR